MRIELQDCNGYAHTISSRDPRILGDWFAEHAKLLKSADARVQPFRIFIWPEGKDEYNMIGTDRGPIIDQDGLLYFAQKILDASAALAEAH